MKLKESPEDFKVEEIPNLGLTPNGKYTIVKLTKKGWNTESAVMEVAKSIGIPRKIINYSGAKDRNALTTQYISLPVSKEKVESAEIENITLEVVGKSEEPVNLGSHKGNRFEIIARECETKPKKIARFVNYFGEQRFGTNNAEVGKLFLKKKWKEACEAIDSEIVKNELEIEPNDYLRALKKLLPKIASMYVHAYQSKLWNSVAESMKNTNKNTVIPMMGYAIDCQGRVGELYSEIMEKEGIEKRDFICKQWPQISCEGAERKLYVEIEGLEIKEIGKKTYKLKFSLPKGSYATVTVSQIFRK